MSELNKRIIFKNDQGNICIVCPTPEILEKYSVKEVADKDVPAGKPYKIIDKSELSDFEFSAACEISDAELTDGVGSVSNEFTEKR